MAFFRKLGGSVLRYAEAYCLADCTVSTVSTAGLYAAIITNVDIEALLEKVGLSGFKADPTVILDGIELPQTEKKNPTAAEVAILYDGKLVPVRSGGEMALAVLYDKKLAPVQFPITIFLTHRIAKFLRAR